MNVHIYSDQMWIDAADKYYLEDNKKHTMVYIYIEMILMLNHGCMHTSINDLYN